jgi:hypothetical protein
MQYLECLYAALADMAHTYQPAERMSLVLRGVMVELRSDTKPDQQIPKPQATLEPDHRESTINTNNGEDIAQSCKNRWTGYQEVDSGASTKKPRTSSNGTTLHEPIDHCGFSTGPPPVPNFTTEPSCINGYTMAPSRSEGGVLWPAIHETLGIPPHTSSTPSITQYTVDARLSGTWPTTTMGENASTHSLANVHFHEMSAFNGQTREVAGMTHVDFIGPGVGGGEGWSMEKEWAYGLGVVNGMNGFPSQGTFNGGSVFGNGGI